MIIPFTDRIKPRGAVLFAIAVFTVQRFEHTDLTFALLTSAFILLSVVAYNIGGGLSSPAGAYIGFNATLTAIVGLTYKLFLGEPGESNLHAPNTTMLAYCAIMAIMAFAAALNRHLRPKEALLPNLDVETMRYAAVGCLVVGALVQIQTNQNINDSGSFSSALHQLNYLPRMSIIFGTIYQLSKSGGKSSTNWIVWAAGLFLFFYGIIGFTKEGLFMSIVTWFLTCVLYRFNFGWKQVAGCAVFVLAAQFILVPFSQYGRRSRGEATTTALAIAAAYQYLSHPIETRQLYLSEAKEQDYTAAPHLYASEQGFVDRLNMLAFDDALIAYTDQGNVYGLGPVYASIANIVPHFIWKDKPVVAIGNDYAHEIGVLAENDYSTGISFGPAGDAYHEAQWFGVLVIFPPIIFAFFFITESLTGNVRQTPYALLPIALTAHAAPEGMMQAPIYLSTYGVFLIVTVALLSKYVLAHFTRLLLGGDRTRVQLTQNFFPGPRLQGGPGDPTEPTPQTS